MANIKISQQLFFELLEYFFPTKENISRQMLEDKIKKELQIKSTKLYLHLLYSKKVNIDTSEQEREQAQIEYLDALQQLLDLSED